MGAEDSLVEVDAEPEPAGDPFEDALVEDYIQDALYYADELSEVVPLPAETDRAALTAGTAERAAFLGDGPAYGGMVVSASPIPETTDAGGAANLFLIVSRKLRNADGRPNFAVMQLAEWWRLNPDGSVTFLRAKLDFLLTADELPPPPADDGGD